MSTPFNTSVLGAFLAFLGTACQAPDSEMLEHTQNQSNGREQTAHVPASLAHFDAAEYQLTQGQYTFAASQLNKGIVAFRVETGKLSGAKAISANRAIDTLTRLRKTLRHGDSVAAGELHRAILSAMEAEPLTPVSPQLPKPDPALFVPVGGN
jgi:predicted FMN-binding regulatory protein PaiB